MAYPKRKGSFEAQPWFSDGRPIGPVLVDDESTPETSGDFARGKPPRIPPGPRATDFAPTPNRNYRGVSFQPLPDLTTRLEYISFLPGITTAVIIAVYLILVAAFIGGIAPAYLNGQSLPAPNGAYRVGVTRMVLIDSTRDEPLTPEPHDRREVVVQVWYPARERSGLDAPYALDSALWREAFGPNAASRFSCKRDASSAHVST